MQHACFSHSLINNNNNNNRLYQIFSNDYLNNTPKLTLFIII